MAGEPGALAHCATAEVGVPAATAYAFMADGLKQRHWALGSLDRREVGDGLFAGHSLFDGKELFVRLIGDPDLLLVDYHLGPAPNRLRRLVEARIVRGTTLGLGDERSVVTLTHWRGEGVSDEEWNLTYHLWQTEVQLIRGALERGL
ncbi:MAG TPA: hypothetical protein VGM91_24270 [Conexibacter sp.]|jgi:hypothetical protein